MSSKQENIKIGDRVLINLNNNFQKVEILTIDDVTEQYYVKILSETNNKKRYINYDELINHCLPIFNTTTIKNLNTYFIKHCINARIIPKMNSRFEIHFINDVKSNFELDIVCLNKLISKLKKKLSLYDTDLFDFLIKN
jgi:hypothetical protein